MIGYLQKKVYTINMQFITLVYVYDLIGKYCRIKNLYLSTNHKSSYV